MNPNDRIRAEGRRRADGRRRPPGAADPGRRPPGSGLELLSVGRALIRRPGLWPSAMRLVPPRWWRRWPPLPLPPPDYARFRMETMYGSDGRLDADELVRYLEWCRRMSARRDNV